MLVFTDAAPTEPPTAAPPAEGAGIGISARLPSSAPTSHRGADPTVLEHGHGGTLEVALVVVGEMKLVVDAMLE